MTVFELDPHVSRHFEFLLSAGDSCDNDRRGHLISGIVLNHEDRSCTALFTPDYGGQVGIVNIVFVNRHMSFTRVIMKMNAIPMQRLRILMRP